MATSEYGFSDPKDAKNTQEEAQNQTPHHFLIGALDA